MQAFPISPDRMRDATDVARMRMVYGALPRNSPILLLTALVLLWLMRESIPFAQAALWFGALLLVTVIRLLLARIYLRATDGAEARRFENYWASLTLLTGLVWSWFFLAWSPTNLGLSVMLGMANVAIVLITAVALGPSLKSTLAQTVPMVAAQGFTMITNPQIEPVVAWMTLILFALALFSATRTQSRLMLDAIARAEELRLLSNELNAMFVSPLAGLSIIQKRHFSAVNQTFAGFYGYTSEEMLGKSISLIYPDNAEADAITKRNEEILLREGSMTYERTVKRADGTQVHLQAFGTPLDPNDPSQGHAWLAIDVTERKNYQEQLATSEASHRQLLEIYRSVVATSPAMIWRCDRDGRYQFASERGTRDLFHVYPEDVIGKTYLSFCKALTFKEDQAVIARMMAGEAVIDHKCELIRKSDGARITLSVSGAPLRDEFGAIIGAAGTNVNHTERAIRETELQSTRDLLKSAIETMPDGFCLFDAQDRITLCNQRYCDFYLPGREPAALLGAHIREIMQMGARRLEMVPPEFLENTDAWHKERMHRHVSADGTPYVYETDDGRYIQVTKRRTPDGSTLGIYHDITQLKRSEDAVRVLAQHDALTGLPNRRLLNDRITQAVAQARRNQELAAVLVVDLDRFKPVNDEHGHRAGDEVLRVVAHRLKDCVREADTVARYGGDEFVVVLGSLNLRIDAERVAQKIINSLGEPVVAMWMSGVGLNPPSFQIGASIGISFFPDDGAQPDVMIRRADKAMYAAKQSGRGKYHCYEASFE